MSMADKKEEHVSWDASVDIQEMFLTTPNEQRFRANSFIKMHIKNMLPCDDCVQWNNFAVAKFLSFYLLIHWLCGLVVKQNC